MPHLATTYAAVNALVTMGGEKALASIDRYCTSFIKLS
jgi:protein farnesyltransferase subunit beta